jgi:hypothetical protein
MKLSRWENRSNINKINNIICVNYEKSFGKKMGSNNKLIFKSSKYHPQFKIKLRFDKIILTYK